jgi:hypothetical protein
MNLNLKLVALLFGICVLAVGCASPQRKAWNYYDAGMILVFDGYTPEEGKKDKVEELFLKAIEKNEDLPGVHASLGTHKSKQGDIEGAKALYTKEATLHAVSGKAMAIVLGDEIIHLETEELETEDSPEEANEGADDKAEVAESDSAEEEGSDDED